MSDERLQRTLVGARDDAAATAVVEQRVDRLLQHALFVADDDVRRAQLDQALQAVVAVDDAAIEVVQVGRREAAAVQRHQRAQFRRDDRHDVRIIHSGLVAGLDEGLDQLQALGELLGLQLRPVVSARSSRAGLLGSASRSMRLQQVADRLGADLGGEAVLAELVLAAVLVFGQQLVLLERGQARLDDDVVLEIEDALEILQRHVEQQADAATAATSGTRCGRPARPARCGPCARAARGPA
jgi:hypothetical protein